MEWPYKNIYFLILILLVGCTSVNYIYKSVEDFPIITVDKLNEYPGIGIACIGHSKSQIIEMVKSAVSNYAGSKIFFNVLRSGYLWQGKDTINYSNVRNRHHQMRYVMVVEVGDPTIKTYKRQVGIGPIGVVEIFSVDWIEEYETQFSQRYQVSLYDIKKERLLAKSEDYLSERQVSSEKYPRITGIPLNKVENYIYHFLKNLESE